MTARARKVFNDYVATSLNHPDLAALSVESHVQNLSASAKADNVPATEISEEVGPLAKLCGQQGRRCGDKPEPQLFTGSSRSIVMRASIRCHNVNALSACEM